MLSKVKKSLVTGLSVVLSASLGCGTCAASDNWHVKVRGGISDPCMRENKKCESVCFNALTEKANEISAFCGGRELEAIPSQFLCCNNKFQKCVSKPLIGGEKLTFTTAPNMLLIKLWCLIRRTSKHFWEKWKDSNRYWKTKHPKTHVVSAVAGALASDSICVMYSGPLGPIFCLPLAMAYAYLFSVT